MSELIADHVSYCAETGELRWKKPTGRRVQPGSMAGTPDGLGYIRVEIHGRRHLAHRLAWLLATGSYPKGVIDHINGNRSDNRLCNLRDVSPMVNAQNQRTARARSKSGLLGAYPNKKGWKAEIRTAGQYAYIGTFKTPAEAHAAYITAKRQLHAGNTL